MQNITLSTIKKRIESKIIVHTGGTEPPTSCVLVTHANHYSMINFTKLLTVLAHYNFLHINSPQYAQLFINIQY